MLTMNMDATKALIDGILKKTDTTLEARYVPAEDESVDDEFEVTRAGERTAISIQVGPGYVGTNRYGYDKDGHVESVLDLYIGSSVKRAAEVAAAAL